MEETFIYALVDPLTFEEKYVGKSNDPVKRLKQHIKSGKNNKTHKEKWINSLLSIGLEPILCSLKKVSVNEYAYWEELYIKHFKYNEKLVLTNFDDQGVGNIGKKGISRDASNISKKVYCFDLTGKFIREYDSCRKAAKDLGISHSGIVRCCNNLKTHTHSGKYIFSYDSILNNDKKNGIIVKCEKKRVAKIDDVGKIIEEYESISEAALKNNVDSSNISRVCNGKKDKIRKLKFKFL